MPSLSLQNDFLSIHGFGSGRIIFSCFHRVQDPVPAPVWCSHRPNYQIISTFVSLLSVISICLFIRRFCIIKGEITLVCLPAKPLHALVILLALTRLFVLSSTFVLTFRKEPLNLSFCKFLVLFHNYYYHYCQILNFDIHSPPRFKNNSMRISKRSTPTIIVFIVSFSGSVDTIVFFKTGNYLPQCLWFSNSFFTVVGCIDCVKGILDS